MQKIYRLSDRIPLKIGGLTIKVGPLTFAQKADVQAELAKGSTISSMAAARKSIQYGLKEIDGLIDPQGNPYKLEIQDGAISDVCMDELMNIKENEYLAVICLNLLNGIPDAFIDLVTGKPLEGVQIVAESSEKKN